MLRDFPSIYLADLSDSISIQTFQEDQVLCDQYAPHQGRVSDQYRDVLKFGNLWVIDFCSTFLRFLFLPPDDILSLQNFRLLLDFFILLSGYFCAWRWYFFPSQFVPPAGILADQKPANFCPSIRGGWGILRFSRPISPKHILSFIETVFFIGQSQNSLMDKHFFLLAMLKGLASHC